jgi:uncharacterized protein
MKRAGFVIGAAFGFLIAAARLNDYDVIHRMLLLQEPDVFLMMASAILTAAPILLLLQRRGWQTPLGGPLVVERAPVQRKHVLGAMLFGSGWAVTGTCPGPAVAMLAGGNLLGIFVMAGLVTGAFLRDAVAARSTARPEVTNSAGFVAPTNAAAS